MTMTLRIAPGTGFLEDENLGSDEDSEVRLDMTSDISIVSASCF